MNTSYSRREFLRISSAGLASLAFRPFFGEGSDLDTGDLVRVSTNQISVYKEPSDKSSIIGQRFRNELLHIYYEVISEDGPKWNPLWYRVWGGYVHCAHTQRVSFQLNQVLDSIPEGGQAMTVTVPFTRSMFFTKSNGWQANYLLYEGSNHWVVDIDNGPDGEEWYVIENDLLKLNFHVRANHLRPYLPEELSPINPDVPLENKRIEIDIVNQRLTAYEYDEIVLKAKVSTGLLHKTLPGVVPTATPKGDFIIQSKMPSKHMGYGFLTDDPEEYVLPGVPWVSFFELENGIAIHGTYWHHNWGVPMSHGCINMENPDAQFIYRWTAPIVEVNVWHQIGYGTRVKVY
jgi:hypothetical protein